MNPRLMAAAGFVLAAAATQASAHARLLAANPAPNTTGPAPKQLVLHFSEKLNAQFSGLALTMPQMNNKPAPMKAAVSNDRLVATPTRPLTAGVYKVSWHAVAADSHRVQGAYTFTVR
jgi:methionine-rich copper-binding protein CopC